MDEKLEFEIIEQIKKDVEKYGSCSIKSASANIFYNDISLYEQKRIAKQIVKTNPYSTEIKNREVIVKRNDLFMGSSTDTEEGFKILKAVFTVIAAILAFLLFRVFLPNL